jgi:hypothetical protein
VSSGYLYLSPNYIMPENLNRILVAENEKLGGGSERKKRPEKGGGLVGDKKLKKKVWMILFTNHVFF